MNASPITAVLLPLALAFIMLYLGSTLQWTDFRAVLRRPRALAVGLVGQMLLLPALAWGVATGLGLDPVMAVGLMVLAACPGGVSSGLLTHLADGDVALSIALTAVTSVAAMFTLPLLLDASLQHFLGRGLEVQMPLGGMVRSMFLLTTLPVLLGTLHVLVPPVLATHVVAPLLAGFRATYPAIVLDLTVELYKEPPIEDFDITLFAADAGFDGDVIARKIITSEIILVAAPAYLARKGTPQQPPDLAQHNCLRFKTAGLRPRVWRLVQRAAPHTPCEVELDPVLWANHSDTLLRAALDGTGITFGSVDVVAPHLASGALVQVLEDWSFGQATLYAALPSRKFLPQRTRVFLDYLTQQTQALVSKALRPHAP